MDLEFETLQKNRTRSLVPYALHINIVGHKWVFRVKHNSDGFIQRYKALLVAKGFHQQLGFDFNETSPVIKPTTIRLVLSFTISLHWPIKQLDFNISFLNGDLQECVYMTRPQGYEHPGFPNHVCS